MAKAKPKRFPPGHNESNTEFVTRMMEFSKHGALMQAFILTAMQRYADACWNSSPEKFDSPLLSGKAWHGCATELRAAMIERSGC